MFGLVDGTEISGGFAVKIVVIDGDFVSLSCAIEIIALWVYSLFLRHMFINPLTPNDHYSGRTSPLTSKRCILYIYSTYINTEYFKYGI